MLTCINDTEHSDDQNLKHPPSLPLNNETTLVKNSKYLYEELWVHLWGDNN